MLKTDDNNRTFRQNVVSKFTLKTNAKTNSKAYKSNKKDNLLNKVKYMKVIKILSSILPRLSKKILEKLKFHKKKGKKSRDTANSNDRQSYTQASTLKVNEILKLKENFPNLSNKKIKSIHNTTNDSEKAKPTINMITKEPSYRQIIIFMGDDNKVNFIASSNLYITNLNRMLKNIKYDVTANFV